MTNYHDFDKEYSNEVINRLSNKFDIKILSYNVKKTSPESWAYINFLTVGNLIVLPVLGKEEEEEQALEQVNAYYPNYTIEQLNISDLVKDGGGLNCVSWCRFINEEERKYLLLYNSLKSEKEMTDDNMFSKDEIIFMCKKNLRKFADKFPGIAEYYIKCLDD